MEDYDEYGNQDGTHAEPGDPVKEYGNISAARGSAAIQPFGSLENYDKVIALGDRDTQIDEYAVLWVDREPEVDRDGKLKTDANGNYLTPWDYTVYRVGRGLPGFGGAIIAIRKVNVS